MPEDPQHLILLAAAEAALRNTASYTYFDRVHVVWRGDPTQSQLRFLQRHCGAAQPFEASPYRTRLELCQPHAEALRWIAALPDDATCNYLEPAHDWVYADEYQLYTAQEFFLKHYLQPYHHASDGVYLYRNDGPLKPDQPRRTSMHGYGFATRQSVAGEPRRGHSSLWYADRACRVDWQPHCLHYETKHCGAQALQRIGIVHPRDLLTFDFQSHFDRWLRFYQLNYQRLGASNENRRLGTRRQPNDVDRSRGQILYHIRSLHQQTHEQHLNEENEPSPGPITTTFCRSIRWRSPLLSDPLTLCC